LGLDRSASKHQLSWIKQIEIVAPLSVVGWKKVAPQTRCVNLHYRTQYPRGVSNRAVQTLDTTYKAIPVTSFRSHLDSFRIWLSETGSSPITAKIYRKGVERWLGKIENNPDIPPSTKWLEWAAPASIKRTTGYALRSFHEFLNGVSKSPVEFWTPRRLPPASRPRPMEISGTVVHDLCLAAKRLFCKETSFTMRIWIRWLAESAVRRSESLIEWENISWERMSVTVHGKTGTRELPLSPSSLRRFLFLKQRGRSTPWIGARGQRLTTGSMYNLFKLCSRYIGRPDLRPHHLRHFRLTRIARAHLGCNELAVLQFAGLSNLSTLAYYYSVGLSEQKSLIS
jgi:hypothetical protein